ncbi:hypothetical protein KIW84_031571 [Lathyrus oleraceus]|uniref:Uncharacterized protein n=1 Tax=Pisum sativum TaxID=3888 RepID=A0A9D4XQZ4_PEA|nr:hypothetical protein KIW84_031571 [Pisum sativum]
MPAIVVALSTRMGMFPDLHERFRHSMRAIQGSFDYFFFCSNHDWLFSDSGEFSQDYAEIGLLALVLLVILSQYIPQKMISKGVDRIAIIVTIEVAWLFAEILTVLVAMGNFFLSTRVIFFAMIVVSLVAIEESTGTFITASRFGSVMPVPPSVLNRGFGWLGIVTSFG